MENKKILRRGFTLVELLAVIVILAVILVIAIPEILNTIEKSKVSSMESSAKLLASTVETKYQAANAVGDEFNTTGDCMEMGNLDTNEYQSCTYTLTNGKAKVSLVGKVGSKFSSYTITDATKYDATAVYDLVCATGYTRVGTTSADSKCVVNTYTVSFNGNGVSDTFEDKTVTYGKEYGTLPTPTRSGYTFYGWYTATTGGTLIESTSIVELTENKTLYARWTANTYAVTVNAGVGAVIPSTSGWTNSSDNTTTTKDLTYDSVYGTLPEPTKTGYTFNGWYLDELYTNKVESSTTLLSTTNHVLYAKWTPNTYTVSFNVNGGTGSYENITVTYDSTYGTLPTPTRTGYKFNGWYTATSGGTLIESTTTVKITEDKTLYASWTANTYAVTVDAKAGAVIPVIEGWTNSSDNTTSTKNLTYASSYGTLPEPTKTGYTFDGWYLEELYTNKVEDTTTLLSTTNHTLYAKWNVNSYTLTVDLNNGTCSGCASTGSQNYGTVVSLGTPTRTNYNFTGWTITSGTATLNGSNLTIGTSDVTVQAEWEIIIIKFTINSIEYEAESGMTWEDWINSDYNTTDLYIASQYPDYIVQTGHEYFPVYFQDTSTYKDELLTDTIVSGNSYTYWIQCFIAGTQVQYDLEGHTKNIEDFKDGDTVVSYNANTGEYYLAKVEKAIRHESDEEKSIVLADVILEDSTKLTLTLNHPLLTTDGFKAIDNKSYDKLEAGQKVVTVSGEKTITSIVIRSVEPTSTYNLNVMDFNEKVDDDSNDTYIANGVITHNYGG